MKITRLLVTALLALAFTAGPSLVFKAEAKAGDGGNFVTDVYSPINLYGQYDKKNNEAIKTISVGLLIEIPASQLLFRHHLSVPVGTTVSQALETTYRVKHGVVCCDSRDIWAINGLAVDPYKEKWWIIKVNGNTQNTSSTRKLSDGDLVELIYMENATYPIAHVRLEEWVKNAD